MLGIEFVIIEIVKHDLIFIYVVKAFPASAGIFLTYIPSKVHVRLVSVHFYSHIVTVFHLAVAQLIQLALLKAAVPVFAGDEIVNICNRFGYILTQSKHGAFSGITFRRQKHICKQKHRYGHDRH